MKIGIVSDVHCNHEALDEALRQMDGVVDEVFVAGDIVYEYRFSNEVVRLVRDGGFPSVLGNHEMVLLGPHGHGARGAVGVDRGLVAHLETLPTELRATIGGRDIAMVHGSPWPPFDRYLPARDPAWRAAPELGADILITGHTHVPMAFTVGGTLVVNPGSLGESREPGARDLVSYAVIDLEGPLDGGSVEIVRFGNPRGG
jgi:putative phosphoesterase